MRKFSWILAAVIMAGGLPALSGCDETIESETETKVKRDGTEITKEEKTVREADGDIRREESKTVDRPD